jgi:hypothetical protein
MAFENDAEVRGKEFNNLDFAVLADLLISVKKAVDASGGGGGGGGGYDNRPNIDAVAQQVLLSRGLDETTLQQVKEAVESINGFIDNRNNIDLVKTAIDQLKAENINKFNSVISELQGLDVGSSNTILNGSSDAVLNSGGSISNFQTSQILIDFGDNTLNGFFQLLSIDINGFVFGTENEFSKNISIGQYDENGGDNQPFNLGLKRIFEMDFTFYESGGNNNYFFFSETKKPIEVINGIASFRLVVVGQANFNNENISIDLSILK